MVTWRLLPDGIFLPTIKYLIIILFFFSISVLCLSYRSSYSCQKKRGSLKDMTGNYFNFGFFKNYMYFFVCNIILKFY